MPKKVTPKTSKKNAYIPTESIVQRENPVLRKIAEEVDFKKIDPKKLGSVLGTMQDALESQDDGVAIAAPQIGESLRIFVVSKRVFEIMGKKKELIHDIIFINPKITKISKEKHLVEEGCLSVRWLYGEVSRSLKATVEARDEHGKKFTMGASGLLAQVFQHEIDHLDGVLFIDKAKNLQDIPPEETAS
jgi:peptide deformylase